MPLRVSVKRFRMHDTCHGFKCTLLVSCIRFDGVRRGMGVEGWRGDAIIGSRRRIRDGLGCERMFMGTSRDVRQDEADGHR